MKRQGLIARLNWFYSLELNQVDLYLAQSKAFKGSYESIVFERTAHIEQDHVENIGDLIKQLGGEAYPAWKHHLPGARQNRR